MNTSEGGRKPANYIDPCSHRFVEIFRCGYLDITVLPELTGHPWDEIAFGYVQGLRPSALRVVKGEETTNGWTWRVTVYLDEHDRIEKIRQEVAVGLPEGINCGADLSEARLSKIEER